MFPFKKPEEPPEVSLHREGLKLDNKKIMTQAAMQEDMYYLQNKEERENLTRWQQDLKDELTKLKYGLMNYELENGTWTHRTTVVGYDKDGNEIQEYLPAVVNALGVSRIMELVTMYLSRNVMNSNLDDNIIRTMMISFGNALALELMENYLKYQLDMSVYHSTNVKIRHMVYCTLYRAYKDGERRHQETQRKMMELYSDRPETGKKGFTASLFGGS